MGQIYFGEDPKLDRQVAVKVSSISEGGEDPRFSKEAKVLAHLAHPNIVPIYSIGVDSLSRPFYSMKLVKGRTLQAVFNAIRDRDAAALKEYPRALAGRKKLGCLRVQNSPRPNSVQSRRVALCFGKTGGSALCSSTLHF